MGVVLMKSKLTDEFIDEFCKALSLGLSVKAACDYVGISEPAYYSYVNKADEDIKNGVKNSKYIKLMKRVKKAKSACKAYHMNKIREASENGNWQASAWTLERCFPDEFGKSIKNDIPENGVITDLLTAFLNVQKDDDDDS